MKILIADDDPAIHRFLRRVLTGEFRVEIDDVNDGMQAIEALLKRHYDLLLLDLNMPVINGLDALKAIRRSARHQGLPVVVMTGEREEDVVIEIITVGVTDYLIKPLKQHAVLTRVGRLLRSLADARSRHTGPLQLGPQSRVVIIDGSREFREFFRRCAEPTWTVEEADTGIDGLRMCADTPPAAVFIGTDLGLLDEPLLVKTLREHPALVSLRMVAVTPSGALNDSPCARFYDLVIPRSMTENVLLSALAPLMKWKLHAESLFDPGSPVEQELLTSVKEAFGTIAGLEVTRVTANAPASHATGDSIEAILELRNQETALALRVSCGAAPARELTAAHHRRDPTTITVPEMLAAVGDIARLTGARLASGLAKMGISFTPTEPVVRSSRRGVMPVRRARNHRAWRFQSKETQIEAAIHIETPGANLTSPSAARREASPSAAAE